MPCADRGQAHRKPRKWASVLRVSSEHRAARLRGAQRGAPLLRDDRRVVGAISSPHARKGILWEAFQRDYGAEGDPGILVAKGSTLNFNLDRNADGKRRALRAARQHGPDGPQRDRRRREAGRKSAVSPAGTTCRLTSVACRPARNFTSARAGPCAVLRRRRIGPAPKRQAP